METFNAQPELEPAAQSLTLRALLLMCAKTAGFALTIVLPVLLVRLLDQNTFGTYRQVFLIAATAQSVLPLSFGMSAYYFLPRYKGDSARYALNILLFNAVIGLAAWAALLVWPGLLTALFGNAGLERYAAAIGAVIALQIFAAPLEVTATALEDMWLATVFIVAAQLSKTVFLLAAALTFRTLDSIVYAVIAQGVLQSCILLWYLQSRYPGLWSKFDFRSMKEQLSYAMPLGAAALVYTLHRDLHNYFVGHRVDAATFAIYSVGCFQLPLIGLLQESVTAILLPKMTKLHKEGRNQDILALMRGAMRKQALVYWPVYFLFLVVAQEFLTFIYTRRFIDSTPIFRVYLTLLPINILVIDPIVRVFLECRYFLLRMRIWVMLVMLVALYLSVRQFGMIGAISVVALAAVAESALSARRIFRILEARTADVIPMFTEAGSIGVLAGISAIPVWFLRQPLSGLPLAVSLIVSGIVFSALYVTLLIVFHIPTAEEMEQVKKGIRSVRTRFARLLPAGAENI